ncbi:CHAT domain-containing protein [Novosphingobium sp.]|uniref:CHAT domain-containing protein n=1 Tax=Novosphingobium sp. TaxID=1874826 RepID=UPI0027336DB9|nr:CHAT domain-containing protein [Novosphingobium sp.]MDP3908195.1 CHAT domain-containing protein [Novosphingobium sp.]
MIAPRIRKLVLTGLLASSVLPLGAQAQASTLPEVMQAGRDRIGQPCTATRDWTRSAGSIKSAADQPFVLTCRGASAAKILGVVTPQALDNAASRTCGVASNINIAGLGMTSARQCQDTNLGVQVVELRTRGAAGEFVGAASSQALLPMIRLLKANADGKAAALDPLWMPVIDLSGLAPAPARAGGLANLSDFSSDGALQQGILFIRGGEHVSASRLLNDALSRIDASTPAGTVIELQMAAALADSGLGQTGPARNHFAAAEAMLKANPGLDRAAYLESALRTYRALDALNNREWQRVLTELEASRVTAFPLADPIALSAINRDSEQSRASGVSLKDKTQYNWLVLDVQRNYARSVALLGLGRVADSRAALLGPRGAVDSFRLLDQVAQPESVNWLRARVQLQEARIAARSDQPAAALSAYDCAIQTMQGINGVASGNCTLAMPARAGATLGAVDGAAIASIQLERASVANKSGSGTGTMVAGQYRDAIDTLLTSGRSSVVQPPALIGYFELLLKQSRETPSPVIEDEYFRVMQAVSDPAIAADMVRLESVIAADGTIAENMRDRVELERQITGLRYRISALPDGSTAERAALEQERAEAEARKNAIESALQDDPRYRSQDDAPISLAELRQTLRPGEVYLKLAKIRTRMFGMVVSRESAWMYGVDAPAESIENLARRVIDTSRSQERPDGTRRIDPFDVGTAHGLFRAIAGPAADVVANASGLVFDPAGQLRTMPAGVLVTDADSVRRYRASGRAGARDFSKVNFLAAKAEISTAISPRSFVVVRSKVAPSTAPRPLLSFGENAPTPIPAADIASRMVLRGNGCTVNFGTWAAVKNGNKPISATQLRVISDAFGVPSAPMITGAAFSDVAIQQASESGELSQYQVLHFATHGLPQTSVVMDGCPTDLPPALITTMNTPDATGPILSNGLLSYDKVAMLKLNANLVVLAACETSSGTEASAGRLAGQEDSSQATMDGLVRAFISANARAVMATYWRVPATTQSDELMAEFYSTGRSSTIGEALRAAQTKMIRDPKYSHPYYWGAYFVVGDSAKSMLSGISGGAGAATAR